MNARSRLCSEKLELQLFLRTICNLKYYKSNPLTLMGLYSTDNEKKND